MENININNIQTISRLEDEFLSYGKVLIALSGGVDSCLAAYLARKFLGRENAVAVISNSASLKEKDYLIAVNFCEEHDIKFEVIKSNELENENYLSNPTNRCYFCKNELYDSMKNLITKKYKDFKIVNGNNYSDLGDYRPGLDSAKEMEAQSPFISCKIDKATIRNLSKYFQLSVWNKPASPCLSSRFPYGEAITEKKLKRVEFAENYLNSIGFAEVRVRSYGDLARIEVNNSDINDLRTKFESIQNELINIGFTNCEIDSEGFISGKMNRVIK